MSKTTTPKNIGTYQHISESKCCECGKKLTGTIGYETPKPGEISLCIYCGSLNQFDDNLLLVSPSDEAIFAAAESSEFQRMRQIILDLHKVKPSE